MNLKAQFKSIPNPFAPAKDPNKISDLFVNEDTKRFFDKFEATREEKQIPMSMMEMPWEQV